MEQPLAIDFNDESMTGFIDEFRIVLEDVPLCLKVQKMREF